MSNPTTYYLQGRIKANYSGFIRDDMSGYNQTKYQLRDLLNAEITGIKRTEEYNPKYLVIGDKYIFFHELNGVLVERDKVFYRANLSNVYITNIHLSEHGKDGIYSFGKLEGIIFGTIIKPITETALSQVISYTDNAEEKQISFINNTSGTLTEVDSATTKPVHKVETAKSPRKNQATIADILGWLFLLFLGAVLLANFWQYIGVILLVIGILFLISWLAGAIKQLIGYIIGGLVILGVLSWLFTTTSSFKNHSKPKDKENKRETTEIRKDTSQANIKDSILIVHHRIWNDYVGNKYETDLIINQSDYFASKKFHYEMSEEGFASETSFWNYVYLQLSDKDKNGLHFIYDKFDSIGKKNNMNQVQFANMIVSCVQDIPYILIANLDCDRYKTENPSDVEIINRTGCFGPVKFGVQSPNEFMYNLKGDCDTRTLFCYTVLSHFNYDVAILSSNEYRHSILGVNMPVTGTYKNFNGNRYYLWETTASGCPPGFLAPDFNNLNNWEFNIQSK